MTTRTSKSATGITIESDATPVAEVVALVEQAAKQLKAIGGDRAETLAQWLRDYVPQIERIEGKQ
jgi:hypothetical protein